MNRVPSLPNVRGVYKYNYPLAPLTWFKVGGSALVLFKPEDEDDLSSFLRNNNNALPVSVLGAGSNVIIRDGGIDGVVVKLGKIFTNTQLLDNGNLLVGAGCLNYNLANFARAHGLTGFEFLVGIPGTIGGGIMMNAGAYGSEFKDIVVGVYALDMLGNYYKFTKDEMQFSYRSNGLVGDFIFTKVEFLANKGEVSTITQRMAEISEMRSTTQPITEKTGGSTFANPPGEVKAWQLIDAVSMRGAMINGAKISDQHCNFMINTGNATALDLEMLGQKAIEAVYEKFGIKLKWEIKIIGKYDSITNIVHC